MGCGADTEANTIFDNMVEGADFALPDINLDDSIFEIPEDSNTGIFAPITKLTNDMVTAGSITGTGSFDVFMKGFKAQLQEEFDKGRISGAEYTKAYVELTAAAMSNAVSFLLNKDKAYFDAVNAQNQARITAIAIVTAKLQLETAKASLVQTQNDAMNSKATFALTKMKLASESIGYCINKYNLDNILPAQKKLVEEQGEAQRAQTLDTRSDGVTAITGSVGKQKALYTQQITSYQRDAEVKAARPFIDAWIAMKTIDEGLLPPSGFENASLDEVLTALKANNGLD